MAKWLGKGFSKAKEQRDDVQFENIRGDKDIA